MSEDKNLVALVGNPNSGKSSLFNALSGLRQQVGNFPGITVEKKTGTYKTSTGKDINLIDLPGLYSLFPHSKDEKIVVEILSDINNPFHPTQIIYVIDPLQMERHLLLCTQLIDMGFSVIVAINMIDLVSKYNISINTDYLAKKLGVPVIALSARTGENLDQLKQELESETNSIPKAIQEISIIDSNIAEKIINSSSNNIHSSTAKWRALLAAHHYKWLGFIKNEEKISIENILQKEEFDSLDSQVKDTLKRFQKITPWAEKTVIKTGDNKRYLTDKIDNIITNKFIGPLIFFGIMFFIFQALFAWVSYPQELIDNAFGWMGNTIKYALGSSWFTSLLTDGILAGIGGIVIFIPQIFILFLIVGILEEIGYMSRSVYMFDNILQKFGLNGRSIVSLISGGACAIPAIMSTRTISNWKERLTTIMVTPLISCSARIPVYIVLVGFVVPDETLWGFFNLQGLVFMGLYVLSIVSALLSALVFKLILPSKEPSFLMIELPRYKRPIWKNVFFNLKEKVWSFIWDAGKVIFFISIILWFLASYGPSEGMAFAQKDAEKHAQVNNYSPQQTQDLIASKKIEASFAGKMGKFIEPAIKPLGFDWKIGIALITSFAAREVFVSTMATIYAIGSSGDEGTIKERLAAEVNSETGEKVYTPAVALSLLIFYLFAMQCMSTLAVTKRETNSWKWPAIQFVFMTALAYIGSFIVYQLMS